MGSIDQEQKKDPVLWEFVPMAKYQVPSAPAQGVVRDYWQGIKRFFLRQEDPLSAPLHRERELHGLSEIQLAHLVPRLHWDHALAALTDSLHDWLVDTDPVPAVQFVVTPPHVDRAAMLVSLADQHRAHLLQPPGVTSILGGDFSGWWSAMDDASPFWVIPDLERYFLRHASGLDLVRELLNRATSGELSRGLIGCDSWSWSYLRRVCRAPLYGAITLQAFDADRLERLFCGMAEVHQGDRICFVNAENGHNIITVPEGSEGSRVELQHLAAHCRGNVATAVTYWRESLRSTQDEPEPASGEPAHSTAQSRGDKKSPVSHHEQQIWVTSLLPQQPLPSGKDEQALLLLHSLMLHGGLSTEALDVVLPFSFNRLQALTERMKQMGLLESFDGRWQVRALACAAVRDLLASHNYLVDDF